MMTNEERLLHALYGIKKVLNDFGLEDIKNEVQFKNGNTETIDCISVLQEFVVNYVNSTQPYKFEDLKAGMWIWDDKWEECFEICEVFPKDEEIHVLIHQNRINAKRYEPIKFEENRFYPVIIGGEG